MTSTLVTVKGYLLAVGGWSITEKRPTKEIYQYTPSTDSWHIVSQLNVARSKCTAALLPDNKLMVVGGGSNWLHFHCTNQTNKSMHLFFIS